MGELPKCPLCGKRPEHRSYDGGMFVSCDTAKPDTSDACELFALWFPELTWRRLAAPPLPPEVVAVLEACNTWRWNDGTLSDRLLSNAIDAFGKAGRPGLPPHAGAGREEK